MHCANSSSLERVALRLFILMKSPTGERVRYLDDTFSTDIGIFSMYCLIRSTIPQITRILAFVLPKNGLDERRCIEWK